MHFQSLPELLDEDWEESEEQIETGQTETELGQLEE